MSVMTFLPSSPHVAFLFSVLIMFLIAATNGIRNESDYMALLSFKSMITEDPYGALSSWNASSHFCDWNGVSCGRRHKRVTAVRLIGQGLGGSLSPHIGNLSFLHEFSLFNNSFQGSILDELGRLSRLRFLDLRYNKFNGSIPTNLSACSRLEMLAISHNMLVGSIPKEMGFLSKLTYLSLNINNLTGGIPHSLGNLTSIERFSTVYNPLGGSIPDTLGHWKRIREFYVGGCSLYGIIPHSFFNLSLLTMLSFSENQITGSLPQAMGDTLPHLVGFQISFNQLTGPIPPSISNCSKLTSLQMNRNNFSGKLQIDFSKLTDITQIILHYNSLHGRGETDDMMFMNSMANCTKLQVLSLYDCSLHGVLPPSIGNISHQLYNLHLAENQLHGSLPTSIGNLVGLTSLNLAANLFTGKIPSTIGKLQNLEIASMYKNQFSGSIPDAIGNLSLLSMLYLYSNNLDGYIPSSLGNCGHLLWLDISNNKLGGEIPKQLLQLSSLSIRLDLSWNNLYGSLPEEVGNLNKLSVLDLSQNNLSGNIPSGLGGCNSLTFLFLEGNSFQGILPPSFRFLEGLEALDLSHNNLSGQIPQFFQHFSLINLNLSYNDFEGEVPVVGVFANASAISVFGNSKLCGGLLELGLPRCKETQKHKKRFPLFVVVISIASALFAVLCLVYVWCKKKRNVQRSQSSTKGRFLKVSYNQLLKATNGFSETNLIGKGGFSSVYKGVIDHDDTLVAVKVLHLQNQGAYKSFIAECEAWRSIRHRNLLKIITSCSSTDFQGNDFKALVYEFMSNGSLHDWLHSSASTSRLNLLQRTNILIDVASALDYLHNHCSAAIVHGDLKPSNILLDDEMVAHVGDFGLARFLETDLNQYSTSGFRGTIGYAAPEYGLGSEMTSSGDVYSFGILLLEVMTRKKPTDTIFNEGLNLHKFASMALLDNLTDVVDRELLDFHHERTGADAMKVKECLASMVKIGVACSVDSPQERMNIAEAVLELQKIHSMLQNI